MKHLFKTQKRVLYKALAYIISFSVIVSSIIFPGINNSFYDDNYVEAIDTTRTYYINSLKDLYIFSRDYSSNPDYQRARLVIDGNQNYSIERTKEFEDDDTVYQWRPIGTSDKPFGGRIEITIANADTLMNFGLDVTLFDYIMDSVEIVNVNGNNQLFSLVKTNTSIAAETTKRLFANHVVHDSQYLPSIWRMYISGTGEHSGLFGTVGTTTEAATVNLNLGVSSSAQIKALSETEGDNNVGLICGTINNGSKVNVTFVDPSQTSGQTRVDSVTGITSGNGCAGGFVGEMKPDSELNIYGSGTNYRLSDSSRTITAKTYAGGLVGKNDCGVVTIKDAANSATETIYNAKGSIVSETAAGGVYGYYKIKSGYNKLSPSYYTCTGSSSNPSTADCSLRSGIAGALVGELDGNGSDIAYSGTSSNKVTVKSALLAKSTTYGGIIGEYSNSALTNKMEIEYVDVEMNTNGATNYGGAVGKLGGSSALYVKVNNFTVDSKSGASDCTYFGGAVGDADEKGSLLDIGSITVTVGNGSSDTYKGGGVVGKLDAGVLRLSGTTDLTNAVCANAADTKDDSGYKSNGQIVGQRKDSLVYALGNGNTNGASYESGWNLKRSTTTTVYADDIATWGEVLRISGAETKDPLPAADISNAILIYNSTSHTVKIGTAVKAMTNNSEMVRTALNMQLNDGTDKGALLFYSVSKRTDLLKATDLTISGALSFSGTGVTGFMRDGYLSADSEIGSFTGTLSKAGESAASITLSVGEQYGDGITDSDTLSSKGDIHGHKYNGLFARTGDNATIQNIAVKGNMKIRARVNNLYAGAAAAYVGGSMNVESVDVKDYKVLYYYSAGSNQYVGGLIGSTNCVAGKTVAISGTSSSSMEIAPVIKVSSGSIDVSKVDNLTPYVGGMIGYISSVAEAETNISYIKLSPDIDASDATPLKYVHIAGMIADINSHSTDTRTLNLSNIEANGVKLKTKSLYSTGGILGYLWGGANVNFTNVELKAGNELNTDALHIGGLVYRATGHWTVADADGIKITNIAIKKDSAVATPDSLGMIVHDGHFTKDSDPVLGLFLELMNKDSYSLASGLSFIPDMTASWKVYDELVAYTSKDNNNILQNKKSGVVSYKTDGSYNMMSGSRNSYQNVYNTSVINKYSRYYYNADSDSYTSNNSSVPGYKLLYWSLNRYAASNLTHCFDDPFNGGAVTGTFDLDTISYYPIDIDSNSPVTLSDVNVIFYNDYIETMENTSTPTSRSTRDGLSQHYLMHMGLFRNVADSVTTTETLTLSGTVGVNDTYSGALICGTMTGSLNTSDSGSIKIGYNKPGASQGDPDVPIPLELKGTNATDKFLLINSIGNRALLDLNNLEVLESLYTTKPCAGSLIGNVQGIGITLKFNKINIEGTTSGSIFNHATLLNKFDVDSTSVATYYFSEADDWGGTPAAHNVTYGKELSESVEYRDQENRYYESDSSNGNYNGNYVSPSSDPTDFVFGGNPTNSATSFATGYLPYVYITTGTSTYTLHEIKVNVIPSDLTDGCGTYDHPYKISDAKQLKAVAAMLDGTQYIPNINLPPKSETNHWCSDDSGVERCKTFSYTNKYTSTESTDEWGGDEVRAYLASAYYQIANNITLDQTFKGLGAYNDSTYAFKGVIVGLNDRITVSNNSGVPLIKISNGSVIKQLRIAIDNGANTVVAGTDISTSTPFSYSDSDGTMIYGGVIGEIMGGDNIIDNVTVTYAQPLKVDNSGTYKYLYTVGGYVGVIVNGALIFRNMTTSSFNASSFAVNGTGSSNFVAQDKTAHLYVNPYIGRVINGYAINETTGDSANYSGDPVAQKNGDKLVYKYFDEEGNDITDDVVSENSAICRIAESQDQEDNTVYQYFNTENEDITATVEATVHGALIRRVKQQFHNVYTLDNGTKNYRIADVKADVVQTETTKEKLYYDTFESKNRVNVPTGQSLFILSLITQSGAGTATTANGNYEYAVGYDGTKNYNSSSAATNTATHLALYDKVGSKRDQNSTTLYKADPASDYSVSKKDKYNNKTAVPYIIYNYTAADTSGYYPARMMTGNTEFMKLTTQNGTYNLPDCFRGIGSIATGNTKASTDNIYQMHIYGFEGNGATINEQIVFNSYINDSDNYAKNVYGKDNINLGMGLFNVLVQKKYSNSITYKLDEGYYIGKFKLTGQVTVKEYNSSGAEQSGTFIDNANSPNRDRYSVGGLTAGILPNGYVNLYDLDLLYLEVTGTSFVGGYIGRNNITELDGKNGSGASKIYVNGCDTDSVSIYGSIGCSGGILGGSISGYPSIYVNTSVRKSGDTLPVGIDEYYKSEMALSIENNGDTSQCGIGAVAGTIRNGYEVDLWVNNLTVKGSNSTGFVNNSISLAKKWFQGAGGLFGFVRKADSVIITNCDINNLNIKAPFAGGLFGNIEFFDSYYEYGTSPVIKIANCKITSDDASVYSIQGIKGSGGITGQFTSSKAYDKTVTGYDEKTYKYDVDGCEVSGYTISQTGNKDELCGAGGLFGFARATRATDDSWTKMRTIVNTSVHDCIVKTEGSSAKHGMSAVIGCVPSKTTTGDYAGSDNKDNKTIPIDDEGTLRNTQGVCGNVGAYNVACYNNTFAYNGSGTKAKYGNFVGNSNSQLFKIVGFTRQNNKLNGTLITADYGNCIAEGSYIINADYKGISTTNSHGEAMSQIKADGVTNVGEGAAKKYFPYVTVSPKIYAQDSTDQNPNILTGDGVSIVEFTSTSGGQTVTTNSPIAKLITDERASNSAAGDDRIKYSNITKGTTSSDYEIVHELITNGENTASDYDIKLTTYFTEMGRPSGYQGDDFPIIAINGAKSKDSGGYNSYINAYIHCLTNSSGDYHTDVSGKYRVDIYPCQCINGVYQKVSGSAGLKIDRDSDPNKFKMDDANADSVAPNNQISMIDINYLDPTDYGKTAYHLYIPVLTKKMLKFYFSSTALQGTEYQKGVYESKYINNNWGTVTKLALGFDTWQTMFFRYDYYKTDIDAFLRTGKGLMWNAPKTVYFRYNTSNSMAGDTQYVLLDNNTNVDKEYYALKSELRTAVDPSNNNKYDIIEFDEFKTSRNGSSPITPPTTFRVQNLNDIAGKSVLYTLNNSSGDNGGVYVECEESNLKKVAYAFDSDGENKKWFRAYNSETDTGLNRYDITVKASYRYKLNTTSGGYVLCSNQETHSDAILEAGDSNGQNKKWFRYYNSESDSGEARYDISDPAITETYYLSMYTFGDSNIISPGTDTADTYGVSIESPVTITSDVITCQRAKAKNTALFLGDFIEQSLQINNYNTQKIISASSNHRIYGDLESTVKFHGDNKAYFHKSLEGETIYQGFNLYLNRYDSSGNPMNDSTIKGSPRLTYTTKVGNGAESAELSNYLDEGAPYVDIPPLAITIPDYDTNPNWSSDQVVKISLEFGSNENKLVQEFPVRINTTDSGGIHLDAVSKLEFTSERVPYSNIIEDDDPKVNLTHRYYIDRTSKKDVLTLTAIDQSVNDAYDMYGYQSHNRSSLGINGLYIDTGSMYPEMGNLEHVEAGLNYDMTNLPDTVFDGTHTLTFKIELLQKVDTNTDKGYKYIPVNITDVNNDPNTGYLDKIEFYGKSTNPLTLTANTATGENSVSYQYYTYSFPLLVNTNEWPVSFINTPANKELNASIKFDVRTNEALEAISGYLYSNYMLKVTAEISGISNQPSDWIVYTNAKMNAKYVKSVTPP